MSANDDKKVEDSGTEADFVTKDKQESWEERFDHNFTGTANIITDFKAYVKYEKRVSELERNKPVTFADLTIETKMIDNKQWYSVEGGLNKMLETEKQKAVEEVFDILITDYYDGISTVDGLREKLKSKI